jgi:hypothetical protein
VLLNRCYSLCSRGRADNEGSPGNISSATESFSGLNLGEGDGPSPTKKIISWECANPYWVQMWDAYVHLRSTKTWTCSCKGRWQPIWILSMLWLDLHLPNDPLQQNISVVSSTTQSNPRPKKPSPSQPKASTTSSSNSKYVILHFQPSLSRYLPTFWYDQKAYCDHNCYIFYNIGRQYISIKHGQTDVWPNPLISYS